jgi:hypothetical protein
MGLEIVVTRPEAPSIPAVLERLAAAGLPSMVVMVDGQLQDPSRPIPERWSDLRIRTPAGTVSLKRRPDGIAVVVFGNADAPMIKAQEAIAEALRGA